VGVSVARALTAVLAAVATAAALAACGSHGGATGTAAAGTAPAPGQSCHSQYVAWEHGPAKAAAKGLVAQVRGIQAAANAQDFPRLDAALKRAGRAAAAASAYPMPRCADPHGYWETFLARIRAGADNASTGSGLGALLLAMGPLKEVPALLNKLSAELKRTVQGGTPLGQG
jgi:hypothetical protein